MKQFDVTTLTFGPDNHGVQRQNVSLDQLIGDEYNYDWSDWLLYVGPLTASIVEQVKKMCVEGMPEDHPDTQTYLREFTDAVNRFPLGSTVVFWALEYDDQLSLFDCSLDEIKTELLKVSGGVDLSDLDDDSVVQGRYGF